MPKFHGWHYPERGAGRKVEMKLMRACEMRDRALFYCPPHRRRNVIQAGGHAGLWPVHLAPHFEHVYTFEPDSLNFRCLVANTHSFDNVHAFRAVLGARPALVDIQHSPSMNSGGVHIVPEPHEGHVVQIELDRFPVPSADLIVLDVEGSEANVLLGAINLIKASRPIVFLERAGELAQRYGWEENDAVDLLRRLGYKEVGSFGRHDVVLMHEDTR